MRGNEETFAQSENVDLGRCLWRTCLVFRAKNYMAINK